MEKFHWKYFDVFNIYAQNIDCVYMLELPQRGGSNKYPQFMFCIKYKKNRYTPVYPSFTIDIKVKWGLMGVNIVPTWYPGK